MAREFLSLTQAQALKVRRMATPYGVGGNILRVTVSAPANGTDKEAPLLTEILPNLRLANWKAKADRRGVLKSAELKLDPAAATWVVYFDFDKTKIAGMAIAGMAQETQRSDQSAR